MSLPAAFLVLPAPNETTLATIVRKVRLLAARRLLTTAPASLGDGGRTLSDVQRMLTGALKTHPAATLDAIGALDVLTPLLVLEAGAGSADALLPDAVAALLAGLVERGALPEPVVWEAPVSRLVDARRGRLLRFDPPARAIAALATGLEVELADGRRVEVNALDPERPFHRITPDLHLSRIDTNPLSMWEEHPEKTGNAIDLGDRDSSDWVAALQEALELVRLGVPTWWAELPLALHRIVPVGFEPERHLSASYREAPGLAYLTLHPDPITLAEALVHETQHSKLNLLTWLDPVLHNGRSFWTASPVRPDLRPLLGVLLAVHAFVPVAALHQGLVAADHPLSKTAKFAERRAQVLAGNERGLELLRAHAKPTDLGGRLLGGLERLHRELLAAAPRAVLDPEALPPG